MNKVPVILGYSGHGFVFVEIAGGCGNTISGCYDMEQKTRAGSVILNDKPEGVTVFGNPVKVK